MGFGLVGMRLFGSMRGGGLKFGMIPIGLVKGGVLGFGMRLLGSMKGGVTGFGLVGTRLFGSIKGGVLRLPSWRRATSTDKGTGAERTWPAAARATRAIIKSIFRLEGI